MARRDGAEEQAHPQGERSRARADRRRLRRLTVLLCACGLLVLSMASQASGAIVPLTPSNASAEAAGKAILADPAQLSGAEFPEYAFSEVEPAASPVAIGDRASSLAGFPTFDDTYAILSSGDVGRIATDHEQNYPEAVSFPFGDEFSPDPARRGRALDWTVLRLQVDVPSGANCAALDYRFLSEEYPTYVGSPFNDAFIAEVDADGWAVNEDGTLTRPSDFAAAPTGEPISVNGVGPTAMSPAEAEGTYFNAATGLITTKTPIASGPHSIYLSIFDASDDILDSAIFLDNLRFIAEGPETCEPPVGSQLVIPVTTPTPTPTAQPPAAQPPVPPSNDFQLGPHVKFKNRHTAALSVDVPGPGIISASSAMTVPRSAVTSRTGVARAADGHAVKGGRKPVLSPARVQAHAAGKVTVTVKLSAAGKKVLAKKHKLTVPVTVTFTPTGGAPASQQLKLTFKAAATKPRGK